MPSSYKNFNAKTHGRKGAAIIRQKDGNIRPIFLFTIFKRGVK
jgi:hypothetical protein